MSCQITDANFWWFAITATVCGSFMFAMVLAEITKGRKDP